MYQAWDAYCYESCSRRYSQILGPAVSRTLQNPGFISARSVTFFVSILGQFKRSDFLLGCSALYFGPNSILPHPHPFT